MLPEPMSLFRNFIRGVAYAMLYGPMLRAGFKPLHVAAFAEAAADALVPTCPHCGDRLTPDNIDQVDPGPPCCTGCAEELREAALNELLEETGVER